MKEKVAVFDTKTMRVLPLKGDKGNVGCRVYGSLTTSTWPSKSNYNTVECATRSLLRMKNLSAVRGIPGASMVGPADYYGNLEAPDKHSYTIEISKKGFPMVFQQKSSADLANQPISGLIDEEYITTVKANWISGSNKKDIQEKAAYYEEKQPSPFGESLFPNPGILEILDEKVIDLPYFDPRNVDFSSFKARLVKNDQSFQITAKKLQSSDEYRAVSFLYESDYAAHQIKNGGGLFLETHDFSQTMTPLDPDAKGFVTLGRWTEDKRAMEIIGIVIPFGYTLIIDEDCIHGDATLDGMFMMCMTTNHVTMQTADSVFLKHPESRENITFTLDNPHDEINMNSAFLAPRPIVTYQNNGDKDLFLEDMQDESVIFNPFSEGWWIKADDYMEENNIGAQLFAMLVAASGVAVILIGLVVFNTAVAPCLATVAAGTAIALTGIGLFSKASSRKQAELAPLQLAYNN